MSTVSNVTAAKPKTGGAVYIADTTATLPTDASTAIDTTVFTCLGYISEDGITNSASQETETIKAWGGDETLVINNGREDTLSFTLIEGLNVDVLAYAYGEDNVSGNLTDGIVININNDDIPDKAMVIDMVMRNGVLKRICLPQTSITELGEVSYADASAVSYAVTIKAMPDDAGNKQYEYIVSA